MRTSNYFPVMLEGFTTEDGPEEADYRRALDTLEIEELPEHSTERRAAVATDEAGRTFRMRAYTTAVGELNVWVDVIKDLNPDEIDRKTWSDLEERVELVGCARFSWDNAGKRDEPLHRRLAERTRNREAAALRGMP